MLDLTTFTSGSYAPEDVTFLLKEVDLAPTSIDEKERLIQSGQMHYSEMISEERRPDARYLEIFDQARNVSEKRIATEIASIAKNIRRRVNDGELPPRIALCSLVRAGVPYGVLLHRELKAIGVESHHFGVSIIRDKGLDENAMGFVRERFADEGILFVDGWTGKGAISKELDRSWGEISGKTPELIVLADPSGYASLSGSFEDWLIPSGILGANVSGLISRSILSKSLIGPKDFHGFIPVNHLADIDVSSDFVDRITALTAGLRTSAPIAEASLEARAQLRSRAMACVNAIAETYGVTNMNRIKPGIAEATRAVLRRKPKMVFLRSLDDPDLSALIHLCRTDGIDMEASPEATGPYRAITLIEKTS